MYFRHTVFRLFLCGELQEGYTVGLCNQQGGRPIDTPVDDLRFPSRIYFMSLGRKILSNEPGIFKLSIRFILVFTGFGLFQALLVLCLRPGSDCPDEDSGFLAGWVLDGAEIDRAGPSQGFLSS